MDKIHCVEDISFDGKVMRLRVDGQRHQVDLANHSRRLARAPLGVKQRFIVSSSGYGIHWPDLDEDLSIDGLLGIKHSTPILQTVG